MSIYTKMCRRDYVQEGFCPTLDIVMSISDNIISTLKFLHNNFYKTRLFDRRFMFSVVNNSLNFIILGL